MIQFNLQPHPKQKFSAILSGRRVSFMLWYSVAADRWSIDIYLDDAAVLVGRKIVTGIDLLAGYNLNIGKLFALSEVGAVPNRDNLPSGIVGLYHMDEAELLQ